MADTPLDPSVASAIKAALLAQTTPVGTSASGDAVDLSASIARLTEQVTKLVQSKNDSKRQVDLKVEAILKDTGVVKKIADAVADATKPLRDEIQAALDKLGKVQARPARGGGGKADRDAPGPVFDKSLEKAIEDMGDKVVSSVERLAAKTKAGADENMPDFHPLNKQVRLMTKQFKRLRSNLVRFGRAKDDLIDNFGSASGVLNQTEEDGRRGRRERRGGREEEEPRRRHGGRNEAGPEDRGAGFRIGLPQPADMRSLVQAGTTFVGLMTQFAGANVLYTDLVIPVIQANQGLGRMTGQLYGAANAGNALGKTLVDSLISSQKEAGGLLAEYTNIVQSLGNMEIGIFTAVKASKSIVLGARALNIEVGKAAEVSGRLSRSMLMTGEKSIPAILTGMVKVGRQFQLTGEVVAQITEQVAEMTTELRRFGTVQSSVSVEMMKIMGASKRFGVEKEMGTIIQQRKSFTELMGNMSQMQVMINQNLASYGENVDDILSGALLRTKSGMRSTQKALADTLQYYVNMTASMGQVQANQWLKAVSGGMIESRDMAERMLQSSQQAAETATQRVARLEKVKQEAEQMGKAGGASAMEAVFEKYQIAGGMEGLSKSLDDARKEAPTEKFVEAADAVKSATRSLMDRGIEVTRGTLAKELTGTKIEGQAVSAEEIIKMSEQGNAILAKELAKAGDQTAQSVADQYAIAVQKGMATAEGTLNSMLGVLQGIQNSTRAITGLAYSVAAIAGLLGSISIAVHGLAFLKGAFGGITSLLGGFGKLLSGAGAGKGLAGRLRESFGGLGDHEEDADGAGGRRRGRGRGGRGGARTRRGKGGGFGILSTISEEFKSLPDIIKSLSDSVKAIDLKALIKLTATVALIGITLGGLVWTLNKVLPPSNEILDTAKRVAISGLVVGQLALAVYAFGKTKFDKVVQDIKWGSIIKALGTIVAFAVGFGVAVYAVQKAFSYIPLDGIKHANDILMQSAPLILGLVAYGAALTGIGYLLIKAFDAKAAGYLVAGLGALAIFGTLFAGSLWAITTAFGTVSLDAIKTTKDILAESIGVVGGLIAYGAALTAVGAALSISAGAGAAFLLVGLAAFASFGVGFAGALGLIADAFATIKPESIQNVNTILEMTTTTLWELTKQGAAIAVVGTAVVGTFGAAAMAAIVGLKSVQSFGERYAAVLGKISAAFQGVAVKDVENVSGVLSASAPAISALVSSGAKFAAVGTTVAATFGAALAAAAIGLGSIVAFAHGLALSIGSIVSAFSKASPETIAQLSVTVDASVGAIQKLGDAMNRFAKAAAISFALSILPGSASGQLNDVIAFSQDLGSTMLTISQSFGDNPKRIGDAAQAISSSVEALNKLAEVKDMITKKFDKKINFGLVGVGTAVSIINKKAGKAIVKRGLAGDTEQSMKSLVEFAGKFATSISALTSKFTPDQAEKIAKTATAISESAKAYTGLMEAGEKISKWGEIKFVLTGMPSAITDGLNGLTTFADQLFEKVSPLTTKWGNNADAISKGSGAITSATEAIVKLQDAAQIFAKVIGGGSTIWQQIANTSIVDDASKGLDKLLPIMSKMMNSLRGVATRFAIMVKDKDAAGNITERLDFSFMDQAVSGIVGGVNAMLKVSELAEKLKGATQGKEFEYKEKQNPESMPIAKTLEGFAEFAKIVGGKLKALDSAFKDVNAARVKDITDVVGNLASLVESLGQTGAQIQKTAAQTKTGVQGFVDAFKDALSPIDSLDADLVSKRVEKVSAMLKAVNELREAAIKLTDAQKSLNVITQLQGAIAAPVSQATAMQTAPVTVKTAAVAPTAVQTAASAPSLAQGIAARRGTEAEQKRILGTAAGETTSVDLLDNIVKKRLGSQLAAFNAMPAKDKEYIVNKIRGDIEAQVGDYAGFYGQQATARNQKFANTGEAFTKGIVPLLQERYGMNVGDAPPPGAAMSADTNVVAATRQVGARGDERTSQATTVRQDQPGGSYFYDKRTAAEGEGANASTQATKNMANNLQSIDTSSAQQVMLLRQILDSMNQPEAPSTSTVNNSQTTVRRLVRKRANVSMVHNSPQDSGILEDALAATNSEMGEKK